MRRTLAILAAAAALAGCQGSSVEKEEDYISLRPRPPRPREAMPLCAVVEFQDKSNYGAGQLGRGCADVLETELIQSKQVRLVTRQDLSKVLDELKLEHSGVTDAATAARVGRVLNVKYIIIGAVTNFGTHYESTNILGFGKKHQIAECEVDMKIIMVETGEIMYAQNGNGKAKKSVGTTPVGGGRASFDQKLAGQSLRAAIVKMLDDILDDLD